MRCHSKGHSDVATRLGATVVGNRPGHRQVRRYDHVSDREHTGTGDHPPALAGLDLGYAGVFENSAASCFERACKTDEILRWIELRLIRKPQCCGGRERQRSFCEHLGLEANTTRSLGFGLDLMTPCRIDRIGIGILRLEIACDIEFIDPERICSTPLRFASA